MSEEKNKGGRPSTVLTPEQKEQVGKLAAVLTMEQLADFLGVGRTTFYEITKRDPEVSELYKKGRAKAIAGVSKSLIQKAMSGDNAAMIFYLKTQAGWKESQQLEHSGSITHSNVNYDIKSDDPKRASQEYLELIKGV